MKKKLWTQNYTRVTVASALGTVGAIAADFALSFLVFDETGSTFASALILAIQLIPYFIVPLIVAPWMDRLPRKPFLVGGDIVNGILYFLAGIYLLNFEFSFTGYLFFSVLLASLGAFDELAFNSIYPKLIPEGMTEKGYTVSSMLYPVLKVLMMPVAAVLFETLGVARILLIQSGLSLLAAVVESGIHIVEANRMEGQRFSFALWRQDIAQAVRYLKKERGLRSIYNYMAVTNGVASGYAPLLIAFFRTTPGFSVAMYSFFSVAEFAGRSLGGLLHYHVEIPVKKRFSFAFFAYQIYELMDMCLLWLPYGGMLVNRGVCGFIGINSAVMRTAAVQQYLPEHMRARMNAWESMLIMAASSVLSLLVGALGEILDYRLCVSLCAIVSLVACWLTIWKNRKMVRDIYEK